MPNKQRASSATSKCGELLGWNEAAEFVEPPFGNSYFARGAVVGGFGIYRDIHQRSGWRNIKLRDAVWPLSTRCVPDRGCRCAVNRVHNAFEHGKGGAD